MSTAGSTAAPSASASPPSSSPTAAAAPSSSPASVSSSSTGGFTLTPLFPTDSSTPSSYCSLLRLGDSSGSSGDSLTILLDCGWDERWDEGMLSALKEAAPSIDLVLLTHPDLAHLGALPYMVGKMGLSCPVYATLPVWRMGQMFLYAAWQERWGAKAGEHGGVVEEIGSHQPPFTLDDVDRAFDQMQQLKYSQTIRVPFGSSAVELTPSCAGHMLGGAFWHIQMETESIIYAVDFNHAGERHLNGALLNAPQLHRPSALITEATNMLVSNTKRSLQDQALTGTVASRLRSGGCVLMPVDAAGRVLELLLVMHGLFTTQQLHGSYTLAFLSPQSRNTVDFARSQLEWMTEKCRKMFDSGKINPFALPHLRLISTEKELDMLPKPYCLLASNTVLETSLAQYALRLLAADPANLLLLTQRAPAWSVAGQLFDHRPDGAPNKLREPLPRELHVRVWESKELQGEELRRVQEERKRALEQKRFESEKSLADSDDDEGDEEGDTEMIDMGLGPVSMGATAAGVGLAGTKLGAKPEKSEVAASKRAKVQQIYPLFPYAEPKRSFDIWGETLSEEELRTYSGKLPPAPSASHSAAALAAANGMSDVAAATPAAPAVEDIVYVKTSSKDIRVRPKLQEEGREEKEKVPLHCSVTYLDLEGRSDGRSIKTVIKDVQPRKLILLNGSKEAKEQLRSHCVQSNICNDVVLPLPHQSVSVTAESNLYRLLLKDSLFSSLRFVPAQAPGQSKDEQLEVAYVEGEVVLAPNQMPMLQRTAQQKGHPAVFLGHIKPSDLQQQLHRSGVPCDLIGGVLVCYGGLVQVRKISNTQLAINGAIGEEYFRVREILYGQYEIV